MATVRSTTAADAAATVSKQTMRIVPVLDLKGGIVVHARRGQRAEYAPLRTPLVEGCEPVPVARALCAAARSRILYVADLDALAGAPVDVATLAALAAVAELWVDAGATTAERAGALTRVGVARNVIGTESLGPDHPGERHVDHPGPRRALSIDLRDGRLISQRAELAGRPPAAAAPLATALEARELLVIDLARVGSGSGPPLGALTELAAALPGRAIYAGGGVRDDHDLRALESAGAAGALVATALHDGRVTPSRHERDITPAVHQGGVTPPPHERDVTPAVHGGRLTRSPTPRTSSPPAQ